MEHEEIAQQDRHQESALRAPYTETVWGGTEPHRPLEACKDFCEIFRRFDMAQAQSIHFPSALFWVMIFAISTVIF